MDVPSGWIQVIRGPRPNYGSATKDSAAAASSVCGAVCSEVEGWRNSCSARTKDSIGVNASQPVAGGHQQFGRRRCGSLEGIGGGGPTHAPDRRREFSTQTRRSVLQSKPWPKRRRSVCSPRYCQTRFDAHVFRVMLLRRLWRPLPLSSSVAGVAVHSTPLATTGPCAQFQECWADEVLLWRARLGCAERRGDRVSQNVPDGDLDLPPRGAVDQRRLEVVVDGLPFIPWRKRHRHNDGLPVRSDELSAPEWMELHWPVRRLVVLGCEVGGRWSDECQSFLRQLSKARVRHEPPGIRSARAWLRRWSWILAWRVAWGLIRDLARRIGVVQPKEPIPQFWWCLKRPGLQSTRRPPRERRKNEISGGREKKRAKFWAVRPRGRPPEGTLRRRGRYSGEVQKS